ncbi:peroxisomal biogenesis factor 3 [Heterostelium album PN500]|uniref:Peroxisomal biogenesis factor 3 n=1 Tax=Heterostelium pallidum (strain ATCC 26659 / Pp 5 / PN500) TaxID=670386 RepID=D3AWZ2_HETP5|nr:peroxisomal biogenesis factor 3 [Heterostelium album PN500]EFA86815.1 peroxisomal biogenesis factor 3 [Heterostelium album PN500]|eukprot:XP_020438918.1 peroxisomal biogenesis factor 3 [Heterostelium album PN500]
MSIFNTIQDSAFNIYYKLRFSWITDYQPKELLLPPPPTTSTTQSSDNRSRVISWITYLRSHSSAVTSTPAYIFNHKLQLLLVSLGGSVGYLYYKTNRTHYESQIKLADERITTFFKNTQATCDQTTILFITKNLEDNLNKTVITPTISEIRSASTPEIKQDLTDKLKISIVTKITSTLYLMPLLLLFIRVQINLVGRYCYLERIVRQSVSEDTETTKRPISTETENKFFSISKHIIEKRFDEFVNVINEQVTIVLKDYKLDQLLGFEDLLRIFIKIRDRFEKPEVFASINNRNCLARYLMPDEDKEFLLLNEAMNIFEDKDFYQVISESINNSFLLFYENVRGDFQPSSSTVADMATLSTSEPPKLHLIALIPKLNKQLDRLINRDQAKTINQLVDQTDIINKANKLILTNNMDLNKLVK